MDTSSQQQRVAIYPRSVKGRYRRIKTIILVLAYTVYFLLPWLRWQRDVGPDQAILFDIVGRKFYLFGLTVYAQDIFWLAGVLIIGAILLFFVTGLAGRVFCGYFCFQTLWTDVFMHIEHWVQGERPARMKLANSPWSLEKIIKLGATHLLWLFVALMTGLAFTLYWGDAPTLMVQLVTFKAPFAAVATILFLTATTYVMAGIAREQVCTYMCPYARFQGVMFDPDTLIVAYDSQRGEDTNGRHKPSRELIKRENRQVQGYGDCIDCGYCVQVCPTGIDIRNGLQLQCITCALCIDACDTIMTSVKYPTGLIRYSSEKELQGNKTHYLKAKTIGYGVLLLASIAILVFSILTRVALETSVRQIRQPLFVTLSDGSIQNRYEVKLNNKTDKPILLHVTTQGIKNIKLDAGRFENIHLKPGRSAKVLIKLKLAAKFIHKSHQTLRFVFSSDTQQWYDLSSFDAPVTESHQ